MVPNADVQSRIRYEKLGLNTLTHYSSQLITCVKIKDLNVRPEKLALVCDGQTTSEPYYETVFAAYTAECAL